MSLKIDPEFLRAYEEAEFEREHRHSVESAIRCVDAARRRLIEAQNELVDTLRGTNDFTREVFAAFYCSGKVTAAEWRRHGKSRAPEATPRGQLRVVRSRMDAEEV
jgi:hypothetical protein